GDLETLLEQVAQMRFDTDVGQHPPENDLADAALAQLQHEVVGLRTPDLVRTDDDRLPILDVGLELLEPVRPGSREPLEGQRAPTSEDPVLDFDRLQRVVELPPSVRWVEIMRRDEDLVAMLLRRLEDAFHVLDGLVLPDALADRTPRGASLAQDIVLWVDEDDCGVVPVELHDA